MKITNIKTVLIVLFLSIYSLSFAQGLPDFFTKSDAFFKAHVKDGKVDYKGIKSNPVTLHTLLDMAKSIQVSTKQANAYKAFWINSYNLTVINGIVAKYPVKSPLDIAGFFDKTKHEIAGQKLTLNAIEHEMLRAKFKNDPRFHFVLVCAGLGCPPLINAAYLPNTLEAQLNKQTTIAVNNPTFIKVSKKKVAISQIFKWYTTDFTQGGHTLVSFLNQYRNEKISNKAKVAYYEYNWNLNKQ